MNKTRVGLLVAAALGILPVRGWAQEEAGGEAASAEAPEGEASEEGAAAEDEGDVADDGAGGGLEEICKIDPAACPNLDMEKEAARQIREELYAVQQIYALRVRRFELNPYFSFTFNDQFVDHPGPGLALNYYITNVLAVGVNGNYYGLFNNDKAFNAQVRRSARVAVPLNEYNWSAAVNATYVFAYGKFAGFGDFIFHYDAYLVAGVGAISTRPIPVIDPDNRNFQFKTKLAFNGGLGLRIFLNRWFAANLELRDYTYNEELENLKIDARDPANPRTWTDEKSLTWNVQAQLGISIFLPFSFDYRLPK